MESLELSTKKSPSKNKKIVVQCSEYKASSIILTPSFCILKTPRLHMQNRLLEDHVEGINCSLRWMALKFPRKPRMDLIYYSFLALGKLNQKTRISLEKFRLIYRKTVSTELSQSGRSCCGR